MNISMKKRRFRRRHLSSMRLKQCLADEETLKCIVTANAATCRAKAEPVTRKFTTNVARVKIRRLYPVKLT